MEAAKQVTLNTGDFQMSEIEVYEVSEESIRISKRE